MNGDIFVYGIIGNYGETKGVTLLDIIHQIQSAQKISGGLTSLTVHINSPGGEVDLGYAIHDAIRAVKVPTTTIIEGMCASIATVIALAGEVRLIVLGSEFMIHNPWTEAKGDVDHFESIASEMRAIEDRMINFYSNATGLPKDHLDALMKVETFLTPQQAVDLGFLTGIIEKQKAVALINSETIMSKTLLENLKESFAEMKAEIKALIKAEKHQVFSLELTTADGLIVIVVPVDGIDDGKAEPGDKVNNADGSAATGNILLADGSTLVIEAGVITSITPKAQEAPKPDDALKAENEALKAEVASLKLESAESEKEIKKEMAELRQAMKNIKGSYIAPDPDDEEFKRKQKQADPVKAAIEERKLRQQKNK